MNLWLVLGLLLCCTPLAWLMRNREMKAARRTLLSYCDRCDSNPREWGVTLRWECRYARAALRRR